MTSRLLRRKMHRIAKLSLRMHQNVPFQKENLQKFLGRGHSSLPRPHPRNTSPHTSFGRTPNFQTVVAPLHLAKEVNCLDSWITAVHSYLKITCNISNKWWGQPEILLLRYLSFERRYCTRIPAHTIELSWCNNYSFCCHSRNNYFDDGYCCQVVGLSNNWQHAFYLHSIC